MMSRPAGVRTAYSRELEVVRAIAALLVFSRHIAGRYVGIDLEQGPPGFFYSLALGGQTGVTLFFVLSAFLLAPPFFEKGRTSISRFFARRFLRLWPLYAFAVLVATAWNAEGWEGWGDGLVYLVYGQSFWGFVTHLEPFSYVWWSLSTEVQFYFVLSLCGLIGAQRFGSKILAALLVLYAASYLIFLFTEFGITDPASMLSIRVSLFGRGWSFLLGALAAFLYHRYGQVWRERLARIAWLKNGGGDGVIIVVLIGIGLMLMKVETIGTWPAEIAWHAWHIPESVLWSAFIIGLLVLPLRSRALLVNRPLEAFGVVSYSFYLWHLPVIVGVGSVLGISSADPGSGGRTALAAAIGLSFAASLALSGLTYRFIERPFLLRKERIAS
ncbi:MAG: acyltransferase [Myxococcota bacterium]|nr:acyltransferase [Myxococcota bacterium]